MKDIVGIIALVAAIYFMIKTMNKKRELGACNGMKVDATIVDYNTQVLCAGCMFHYPIYEYVVDNETLQYVSQIPFVKQICVGTKIKLNYNATENKIVDSTTMTANTAMAALCGGVAMLLLAF